VTGPRADGLFPFSSYCGFGGFTGVNLTTCRSCLLLPGCPSPVSPPSRSISVSTSRRHQFRRNPKNNYFGCVWRTPSVYVIDSCVLDHPPSKMHKLTPRDTRYQHIPLPFRLMIFLPVQKIDFPIRNGRLLFSLPDRRESSYQIGRL